MKVDEIHRLIGQRPTHWEMDFTPPLGDWDVEELWYEQFNQVFNSLGQALNKNLIAGYHVTKGLIDEMATPLRSVIQAYRIMEKLDDQHHGNHLHAHVKKSGQRALPRKKSNTGPPWNPHARGGRGGK